MKVAIDVPKYLPGPEYFLKIALCDTFVFLENTVTSIEHTRTSIKTPAGRMVLSVPIYNVKDQKIKKTRVIQNSWQEQHWSCIKRAYTGCKHHELMDMLQKHYLGISWENLTTLNIKLIKAVSRILGYKTKFSKEVPENGEIIDVSFQMKPYKQMYGEFVGNLGILDYLFNCGIEGKYDLREYFSA